MQLRIEGMTCGGCANSVTKVITALDSAASVQTDPATRTINVETSVAEPELRKVLAEAGYPASER